MATLHFIKNGDFDTTLDIADRLLNDNEDLIHKATGWMLREVGNRNKKIETQPRMLRHPAVVAVRGNELLTGHVLKTRAKSSSLVTGARHWVP